MSKRTRQDLFQITVVVDDRNIGVFEKKSGFNADSEDSKIRPGGTPEQESLGGPQTVENGTVSRYYDLDRDGAILGWLLSRRGKAEMKVITQPLDRDYNAYGRPLVVSGTLKAVQAPDADSESTDGALLALECGSASIVS
jgi:hypothetical protein